MKVFFLIIALILLINSCGDSDVSNNPKYNFGFKVGYIYQTKVKLHISALSSQSESSSLMKIRVVDKGRLPEHEILPIGSKFKITKIIYNNKSGLVSGHGIIIDGKFKDRKIRTPLLTDKSRRVNGMRIYPDKSLVTEIAKDK